MTMRTLAAYMYNNARMASSGNLGLVRIRDSGVAIRVTSYRERADAASDPTRNEVTPCLSAGEGGGPERVSWCLMGQCRSASYPIVVFFSSPLFSSAAVSSMNTHYPK